MTDNRQTPFAPSRKSGAGLYLGIAAVLSVFLVSGLVSYFNTRTLNRDAQQVTHTHEVLSVLNDLLSLMKDAETGQRVTFSPVTTGISILSPQPLARIDQRLGDFETLSRDNPTHQTHLPALKENIDIKLRELAEAITLRQTQGFDAARTLVMSDRGKTAMDTIRNLIQAMQTEERGQRSLRIAEMEGPTAWRSAADS